MAVVPLKKIRLYIHKSARDIVLAELQNVGAMSFEEVSSVDGLQKYSQTEFDLNRELANIEFAISFLNTHVPEKVSLKKKLEGNFITTTDEECRKIEKEFPYQSIVQELQHMERELNVIHSRTTEIEGLINTLTPWQSYKEILSVSQDTAQTIATYIYGDQKTLAYLSQILSQSQIIHSIQTVGDYVHILTTLTADSVATGESIVKSGAQTVVLPSLPQTAREALRSLKDEMQSLALREKSVQARIAEFSIHRNKLKQLADIFTWKKERYEIGHTAHHTHSVLVFEGWIKERHIQIISNKVSTTTSLFHIEMVTPSKDEEIPVEIENGWLVKPFETITRLYGLPSYYDLDPTAFLAVFFFLFFGLCLTDVGYGIFVMLLTGILLAFFRLPKDNRPFVLLMFLGGLSSALIGLLFGGYLGIDTKDLPVWTQKIQAFNPVLNPLPVLFLSLGLGVVQIMFGIFLRIVREWKNGNRMDGIIGYGPWLFFFLAFILFGLHAGNILTIGTSTHYLYTIYASVALLVLTQGRHEKNIFMKAFKGVMSLYDSISYFSDILSYSRILALGLATTALAFSINLIADLIKEMIPFVGGVLAILILIAGHLFNLAVNMLGAFIHSARLQFVEFFSKFIVGTGKEFRSFKRIPKFVHIE